VPDVVFHVVIVAMLAVGAVAALRAAPVDASSAA
jgi:hypothetical protein